MFYIDVHNNESDFSSDFSFIRLSIFIVLCTYKEIHLPFY